MIGESEFNREDQPNNATAFKISSSSDIRIINSRIEGFDTAFDIDQNSKNISIENTQIEAQKTISELQIHTLHAENFFVEFSVNFLVPIVLVPIATMALARLAEKLKWGWLVKVS